MKTMIKPLVLALSLNSVLIASVNAAHHEPLTEEQARALVQPFYDYLGGDATEADVRPAFVADWQSFSGNDISRGLDDTLNFVGGPLQQMVPDLNWKIVDVSVTVDNEIVVRGEATGTPAGDSFFGQPNKGKPFKIMSIDVHTVENGKIIKTYHVEDWSSAFRQIAAE